MKAKELKNMEEKKLRDMLEELRKELMKLRSQVKSGLAPDNPSKIREVKKDIARILTVMEARGQG